MNLKILLCTVAVLLSACASVGTQYMPATDQDDAAELTGGPDVFIVSFDDKGCYSGRTQVEDAVRLHANQPVVVSDERKFYRRQDPSQPLFCRNQLSFVPEKDAVYRFRTEVRERETAHKTLFGNTVMVAYCTSVIERINADGTTAEAPTTPLAMHQRSLACIRAEPFKPAGGLAN